MGGIIVTNFRHCASRKEYPEVINVAKVWIKEVQMKNALWSLCCLLISLAGICVVPAKAAPKYHLIKKVVLGGEGFWDYLKCDSANHRLFISRGTHVMVVDTKTLKVIGDIPGTAGVHGIALAPEFNHGFTSDGQSGRVTMFDYKTLAVISQIKVTGEGPDGIIYDPDSKRVFTFNGRGQNSTAINAEDGSVAGTVDLGGRPEFAVADGQGHVYNNLEDKSVEVEIDSETLKVINRWPLAPCESPSGIAMDAKTRRLFIGCHNKMMAIMDADTGKVIATPPIGQGVDANAFDPGTGLAFSSNGDGTLTVVHEDSPDKFTVVGNVSTQRGARTMALDTKTHIVYLVTAEFGPAPAPTPGQRFSRPPMVPNSFTLLVFGN
jgi:DNA-binding beta-propeller fold protein YncE